MIPVNTYADMQAKAAINWINALYSGEYKQCTLYLGDDFMGHCAWGLGCKVLGIPFKWHDGFNTSLAECTGFRMYAPPTLENSIPDTNFAILPFLNDTVLYSFIEIANILVYNAQHFFREEVAEALQKHFLTS